MKTRIALFAALGLAVAGAVAGALWWTLAPPPRADPAKLTVALSGHFIGSGLVFIAQERGYFAEEGLAVDIQRHTSGASALASALGGRADLATAGDTPLTFAALEGAPFSIVATIFTSGGTYGIVARRDRGIATTADLAGKAIGATLGTDGHFVAGVLLSSSGLPMSAARLVNFGPEGLAGALAAGTVDAVSTWEPWLGHARKALGDDAVVLLPDSGFRFNFSLAGRKSWVDTNQDRVRRLLRALDRALELAESSPADAQAIVARATEADPAIFAAGGPHYQFQVRLDQGMLIMLEDQARWAIGAGLTERSAAPNLLEIIDTRPLAAVKPSAVSVVN